MELAMILFSMFYAPKPHDVFIAPNAHTVIEAAPAPVVPEAIQFNLVPEKRPYTAPTQPDHGQANPADFYNYTCPTGQYPIGDGQCHINNDRPGDIEK